jgi:multidrug resistance efflux pump
MTTQTELETAHDAAVAAVERTGQLRADLFKAQAVRREARAALATVLQDWQKSHQLTPDQLRQSFCQEQQALRAARAAQNPNLRRAEQQRSREMVWKNMRGLGPRRGAMSKTDLMRRQIAETGTSLPFDKASALMLTEAEKARGHVPIPETKR